MFKVDKGKVSENKGTLYLLEIELEEKTLVKIGVTSRKIEDRVVEILTSCFHKYRLFPYCRPKRFRQTEEVYKKESMLHSYFKDYKYNVEHPFSGSTELFNIPLDKAVEVYEHLLDKGTLPDAI